jgi:hypothetical protein
MTDQRPIRARLGLRKPAQLAASACKFCGPIRDMMRMQSRQCPARLLLGRQPAPDRFAKAAAVGVNVAD